MEALQDARNEMANTIAQRRIDNALRSNVPSASSYEICIGSEIIISHEEPVNKWVGPFKVRDVFGKHVFIDTNGRLVQGEAISERG